MICSTVVMMEEKPNEGIFILTPEAINQLRFLCTRHDTTRHDVTEASSQVPSPFPCKRDFSKPATDGRAWWMLWLVSKLWLVPAVAAARAGQLDELS